VVDERGWQEVGEKVAVGVRMEHEEHQKLERLQVPEAGDLLDGRYHVTGTIATGGMGVILRAEQLPMQRPVAIKLLHPHIAADPEVVERFEREVSLAKQLNHPNTIRLYDYGESNNGLIYVAMELLEGMDLKRLIAREGGLGMVRSVGICRQMLDGLAEAHARDFIHRDLKPSNVFITENRRGEDVVKLLDFGIAKSLGDAADLTGPGSICGTPSYVAPEYLMQEEARKPSDVYAVGLILLEMLTGRQVFRGETPVQTMMMHLKLAPELPEALEASALGEVILQATAKEPRARFRDAEAMYKAVCEASAQISADVQELPSRAEGFAVEANADERRRDEDHTVIVEANGSGVAVVARTAALVIVAALAIGAGLIWALDPGSSPELQSPETLDMLASEETGAEETGTEGAEAWAAQSSLAEEMPLDRSPDAGPGLTATPGWDFNLDTDPSGAAVFVGGQKIGRTPISHAFEPAELPKTVRFELAGHQPLEVELGRTSSPIVVEVLEVFEVSEEPRGRSKRPRSRSKSRPEPVEATGEVTDESSSGLSDRRIEEVVDQYLVD
jgi:serine/threonine-protein kinase